MPRLLRFTIMNDADSPPSRIGAKRRQSSPPGIFSTLMTSAPMSASIMPQIGPDMMCESSMTRMPLSGPLDLAVSFASISTPLEFRFDLVEKGLVSGTKILRAKTREAFIALLGRRAVRGPSHVLQTSCASARQAVRRQRSAGLSRWLQRSPGHRPQHA